jgi:hypothetical protein
MAFEAQQREARRKPLEKTEAVKIIGVLSKLHTPQPLDLTNRTLM